jgi:hypothetical protein
VPLACAREAGGAEGVPVRAFHSGAERPASGAEDGANTIRILDHESGAVGKFFFCSRIPVGERDIRPEASPVVAPGWRLE